ncbi:MAG: glycerophosphodiester phosphodiesterase family protein [Pseudomonadota bacterium]
MAEPFNLAEFAYAHRGLWRPEGPPENSLSACLAAAEAGFGIEFDIRPSAEGEPVIFHDPTLERMTGVSGRIEEKTLNTLETLSLKQSTDTIISLTTLLTAWPATTPLLCELKIDGQTDPEQFAEQVGKTLMAYRGPAAAMSFSIAAVRALPKTLMRGQLIPPRNLADGKPFQTTLESLHETKPDYLAPHTSDARVVSQQAERLGLPCFVWTVTDAGMMQDMRAVSDAQIFENIETEMVKTISGSKL